MAFKMKGNPFTKGTVQGTKSYSTALKKLKLNRDGYEGTTDGRATSSPFQLPGEKTKDKWGKRTETSKTADLGEGVSETTTTGTQSGTRGSSGITPKGPKACDKNHPNYPKSCEDYKKSKELKRGDVKKTCNCTPPGGEEMSYEAVDCVKSKPAACKEKTEKECSCISKQTYSGVKKGDKIIHKCGRPHPGCSEKPGKTPPSACTCTPPGSDKSITYDCDKPRPAECASKGSTKDCPDSKRESCGKNRMWSFKKCRCVRRKKVSQGRGGIKGTVKRRNLVTGGRNVIQGKGFSVR